MSEDIFRHPACECPICGYRMEFVISKKATLKSLEDMNWKQRAREAIEKYSKKYDTIKKTEPSVWAMVKHDFKEILEELGL